jgi:hypothetical protein
MKALMLAVVTCFAVGLAAAEQIPPNPQPYVAEVPVIAEVVGAVGAAAEIEGPSVVTVGQPVQFSVTGLDESQLEETDLVWFPREGVTCILATTWPNKKTIIWFIPGKAPEYMIALYAPGRTKAEIIVSTDGLPVPPPDPTPDPIPPPTPGERLVVVIHESGEVSTALAQSLQELRNYATSESKVRRLRILDPDLKGPDDKTPAWFQSYLDLIEAKALPLPVLMVGVLPTEEGKSLSAIYVEPLPDTGAAIIEAVKKYGG